MSLTPRIITALLVLVALGIGTEIGRRFARPGTLAQDAGGLGEADTGKKKSSSAPLRFVPKSRRESRPILLPTGEVYLLDFLQGLSDSNARTVYLDGKVDSKTSVRIRKNYTKLSFAEAEKLLAEHDLYLSETEMGGNVAGKKKVYWVQPKLKRVTRRGSLVRRGGSAQGDDGTGDTGGTVRKTAGHRANAGSTVERRPIQSGHEDVRIYRRDDGSLITWLVQYETSSRKDAEDMVSVMQANLEASARK
jgi:hypothetical protein